VIGDFATLDYGRCVCGRGFARARGGFQGRADDMLNVRGLTLFPSVIEQIVRSFDSLGDEFQVVLATEGVMDSFAIVVESKLTGEASQALASRVAAEVVRRCELRPKVEIVAPGTLPKAEFKARRVIDRRRTL